MWKIQPNVLLRTSGDSLILADIAFFKYCIYELIDTIDTTRRPHYVFALDLCSVSNLHGNTCCHVVHLPSFRQPVSEQQQSEYYLHSIFKKLELE